MNPKNTACCLALVSALVTAPPLLAVDNHAAHRAAVRHEIARRNENAEEEGQRVFEQNCARCHNAPDGFSSRIAGTIVRHMRVRANLSQHDEQALLHFFNVH